MATLHSYGLSTASGYLNTYFNLVKKVVNCMLWVLFYFAPDFLKFVVFWLRVLHRMHMSPQDLVESETPVESLDPLYFFAKYFLWRETQHVMIIALLCTFLITAQSCSSWRTIAVQLVARDLTIICCTVWFLCHYTGWWRILILLWIDQNVRDKDGTMRLAAADALAGDNFYPSLTVDIYYVTLILCRTAFRTFPTMAAEWVSSIELKLKIWPYVAVRFHRPY